MRRTDSYDPTLEDNLTRTTSILVLAQDAETSVADSSDSARTLEEQTNV